MVLFDDYDLVAGPTGGPLAPLLDVLAVGGDVGLHVVLARRVGGSARGAYEAVFGRLRELGSPGVLLSGDPAEGPLLGGAKAQPQPAGRGLLVRRGERPVLIQTAFSPPTPVPAPASRQVGPRRGEHAMNTCAVTIAGPDRRVDLVVSTETPIAELIPTFVELSMDEAPVENGRTPVWTVAPPGHQPLPLDRTLGPVRGRRRRRADADRAALAGDGAAEAGRGRPQADRAVTPRHAARADAGRAAARSSRRASASPPRVKAFFGYEEEPPIAESPEPPTAEQARGAHQARAPVGERALATASWRETDYEARLDRAIASPRLTRCATIAVVSPKGGVGKTTLTVLLGSLLARVRRDRIVAVDTNPDFGSLGRTLTPDHQVFVDDLGDMLEQPDLSVTALDRHLGRAFEGLMVLPAPTDPSRMAQLNEESYRARDLAPAVDGRRARARLRHRAPGARRARRPGGRGPDRAALRRPPVDRVAGGRGGRAAAHGRAAADAGRQQDAAQARHPARPRAAWRGSCPTRTGLVTLDEDLRSATKVASGDYSWDDAPPQWRRAIRELAVSLQADWPALGITTG